MSETPGSHSFFPDIEIGKEITLDIDLFVEDWLLLQKEDFLEKISKIEESWGVSLKVWYRRSSHNNVHIKLEFPCPLSMLEVLLFRAWLDDDRSLLYIDMKRYFKTGDKDHRFMRRFDCKGKINDQGMFEITHAGQWIPLQ